MGSLVKEEYLPSFLSSSVRNTLHRATVKTLNLSPKSVTSQVLSCSLRLSVLQLSIIRHVWMTIRTPKTAGNRAKAFF